MVVSPDLNRAGLQHVRAGAAHSSAHASYRHERLRGKRQRTADAGRRGAIGAQIAAALRDDRLERCHLQQTFAAAGDAEAARFAAAEADARIGGGDDQVVDQHGADRQPRSQGVRFALGPEDSRGERVGTRRVRGDRGVGIRHIEDGEHGREDIALRDAHFGRGPADHRVAKCLRRDPSISSEPPRRWASSSSSAS